MDLTTYNVGGHGRPGIFIFGSRTAAARYPFPVSILIRWRDPAIVDYLESDAGAREGLRRDFEAKVKEILNDLETRFLIDWQGSSQDAEHGLVVELEGF